MLAGVKPSKSITTEVVTTPTQSASWKSLTASLMSFSKILHAGMYNTINYLPAIVNWLIFRVIDSYMLKWPTSPSGGKNNRQVRNIWFGRWWPAAAWSSLTADGVWMTKPLPTTLTSSIRCLSGSSNRIDIEFYSLMLLSIILL